MRNFPDFKMLHTVVCSPLIPYNQILSFCFKSLLNIENNVLEIKYRQYNCHLD